MPYDKGIDCIEKS